jgi:hypothetical protein
MAKGKKHRRKTVEYAYYHVQITGWDWSYSFSTNVPKWDDQRFSDYRHLVVRGTVLRPRKIKAETAELWFLPSVTREDFEPKHNVPAPRGVGSLSIEGSKSEPLKLHGYLSMPEDALVPVLKMLIAGRFKFVLMDGQPMRYRHCFVRHYELTAQHDEADHPDDP